VALIVFASCCFVNIPGGALSSVLGLVIFAGFTMFDFQRLRTSTDVASAPFRRGRSSSTSERLPVLPADLRGQEDR